jgi:arylsulfatase A-like enzyme/Flp pilus assembly protein TadD
MKFNPMRDIIIPLFLGLVLFLLSCPLLGAGPAKSAITGRETAKTKNRELNVLLITIDTLRTDRVSAYSPEHLQTPHIDGIASKGVVFTKAYAHNPLTLASHVNILTGTTPLYHGISDNAGYKLEDRFLTIAELLKEKDYSTGAFIGAFPLDSRFGLDQGFDVYDDSYGTRNPLGFFYVERRAEKVIEPAVEWMKEQTGKWFCWIHLFDPHQPYLPPAPYDEKFRDDLYSGEMAYVDDQLGRVFNFLKENNELGETIIVFTADHGEGLGDHGERTHSYFAYNSTIHVPLILYHPELSGKRIDTNVCHIDIFPTICDVVESRIPDHVQGESLIPIINGRKKRNSSVYFESMSPYLNRGWAPLHGLIEGDLKYIHQPVEEVYDLKKDFHELNNLAESSDLKGMKKSLQDLEENLGSANQIQRRKSIDSESLAKFRALGYISSSSPQKKSQYTEKDDLKTLLPLQNKVLDGIMLHQAGQTEKAIVLFKQIISESKTFVMAYNNLANIYRETGRTEEAIEVLRDGLNSNNNNVAIMSKMGIILPEANRSQEAIEILKRCTDIENFNPEYWNYLGIAYYKAGQLKNALEAYSKAIELDADYALAHNNIGNIYLAVYMKNPERIAYDMAVRNFKKAIELDPELASAYNGLGGAYRKAGRIDDAIFLWEKSLELNPDFSFPFYNLGAAYLERGDKHQALEYFEKYKARNYDSLSLEEKEQIDEMIKQCGKR